jgi:uncharacterized integral membrane protein (TIGR00698 family)
MADLPLPHEAFNETPAAALRRLAPGMALAAAVAAGAVAVAALLAPVVAAPAMVIALGIGMLANPLAARPAFSPGIAFCVRTLLRCAIALLGLRIALSDVAALGLSTAVLVVLSMAVTVVAGLAFARALGQSEYYGALTGVGTAVCGASATLATSTMLPDYAGKQADVVFVIVAVNALSTAAMVLYPLICLTLGFDGQTVGVMLGATIHDMAQVVGAGYAVSDAVGDNAVIVKLFRVLLLLPVVLAVALYFSQAVTVADASRIPFPLFAVGFIALCLVNSAMPLIPGAAPVYAPVRTGLLALSSWGLLIAIGALGLSTSFAAIAKVGWRHLANVAGTTLVILVAVSAGLLLAG